jgi:lipoic acid synthetase
MRKPDWLRTAVPAGATFEATNERLRSYGINTVCSSARCPNLAECWGRGTTTFMILGDTCTRHCRFCAVKTGNPQGATDDTEPGRVARAVAELGLFYVVLTSVDRDDLPDLGAGIFAETVEAVRGSIILSARSHDGEIIRSESKGLSGEIAEPSDDTCENAEQFAPLTRNDEPRRGQRVLVEVLTPDFGDKEELIGQVVAARPEVFGHNIETVERLSSDVRDPRADYRRSLDVLATVKRLAPKMTTKSGLMVGLGETDGELRQALRDLRSAACDIVTVGQYLQPTRRCLPVERYVTPDEFIALEKEALAMGFKGAFCGPLVRSSFHAADVAAAQGDK